MIGLPIHSVQVLGHVLVYFFPLVGLISVCWCERKGLEAALYPRRLCLLVLGLGLSSTSGFRSFCFLLALSVAHGDQGRFLRLQRNLLRLFLHNLNFIGIINLYIVEKSQSRGLWLMTTERRQTAST